VLEMWQVARAHIEQRNDYHYATWAAVLKFGAPGLYPCRAIWGAPQRRDQVRVRLSLSPTPPPLMVGISLTHGVQHPMNRHGEKKFADQKVRARRTASTERRLEWLVHALAFVSTGSSFAQLVFPSKQPHARPGRLREWGWGRGAEEGGRPSKTVHGQWHLQTDLSTYICQVKKKAGLPDASAPAATSLTCGYLPPAQRG